MKKKYYTREVNGDTLIWDVDKLVKLSEHYLPKEVMLESIDELDENYWFQDKKEIPSVREIANHIDYADKTSLKYPVILSSDGKVMEGMHRVLKALMKGKDTIKIVQFLEDPEPDYKNKKLNKLPQ
jgi:hypothetical protein